jgi:hypothetical protein
MVFNVEFFFGQLEKVNIGKTAIILTLTHELLGPSFNVSIERFLNYSNYPSSWFPLRYFCVDVDFDVMCMLRN